MEGAGMVSRAMVSVVKCDHSEWVVSPWQVGIWLALHLARDDLLEMVAARTEKDPLPAVLSREQSRGGDGRELLGDLPQVGV